MKTKSFLAMSLMALLAAGCASDEITSNDGENGSGIAQGPAYVALNITLPTSNGSRADYTENFDQGDGTEYNVDKMTITFYTDATCTTQKGTTVLSYTKDNLSWESPASPANGITTKILLPVEEVDFSGDAWAVVEINKPESGVTMNGKVATTTAETLVGGTGKNSFYMTNAANHGGTNAVKVTSYTTKAAAQANYENIYVERAVAKVQLSVPATGNWSATGNTYTSPSDEDNAEAQIRIDAWALDITNKKTYLMRNFGGTGTYTNDASNYARFYGTQDYRTYWAQDPNYNDTDWGSGEGYLGDFIYIATDKVTNTVGNSDYCLENTFDTKHQKQNETTRVVVKATYAPKGITLTNPGTTWHTIGNSGTAYTTDNLQTTIKTLLGATEDVTLQNVSASGTITIEKGTFKVGTADLSDEQLKKIQDNLGKTLTTYWQGVCYYPVRIKHCGEYECPWTAGNDYTTGTPEMEKKYLGRYGVVRNNWYKLTINKVTQPGTTGIPSTPDKADDEQNYYLQAQIQILDWAVRNQSVEL